MSLLEAVLFSSLWAFVIGQLELEQPEISFSSTRYQTAQIPCKVFSANFHNDYIHWYRQKPGQNIEHLMYVQSTTKPVQKQVGAQIKLEARKDTSTSTSTLKIDFLEKEDEAMYYCACWTLGHSIRITKITYTKTTSDRSLEEDFSPKPTVFLPSIAEINLHKAGTYLCLLEDFSPDVIEIDWKEKNGDKILESQAGNTTKTGDRYMKFSWLTVLETSMDKDHVCIIKRKSNKGGVDQEIVLPSIKKVKEHILNTFTETTTVLGTLTPTEKEDGLEYTMPTMVTDESHNYLEKFNLEDENRPLQLQFMHTSVYYTYVLLLLKSMVYFVIITFSVLRRTGACGNGKSP